MPNGVDEGVIAYSVYEDEKMFYGVAEVDLPDFENEVFNVSGAGVLGEIEIPVAAHLKAMTTTFKFNHTNEAAYALAEERVHTLSLCVLTSTTTTARASLKPSRRRSSCALCRKS